MKRSTINLGISGFIGIILIIGVLYIWSRDYRFIEYVDPEGRFSIKYPSSWSINPENVGPAVMFMAPLENSLDYFKESVNIVVQDLSKNPQTLTDYSAIAIKQMEVVYEDKLVVEETAPTIVSGKSGFKFIFIGKAPPETQPDVKYMMIWTVVDKHTAYQVTYAAFVDDYDRYVNKVKIMMASFKILDGV